MASNKFYYYEQQNIEGITLCSDEFNISNHMIIEAASDGAAKERLFSICDQLEESFLNYCPCCGARWVFVDEEEKEEDITKHIEGKYFVHKIKQ